MMVYMKQTWPTQVWHLSIHYLLSVFLIALVPKGIMAKEEISSISGEEFLYLLKKRHCDRFKPNPVSIIFSFNSNVHCRQAIGNHL